MKNPLPRRLRALLSDGQAPAFRLPTIVLRQFVGYYGDWRRSRDILNSVDDTSPRRPLSLSLPRASSSDAANSFPAR
jgi:hypothetical protein